MKPQITLILAAGLLLAGCGNGQVIQCPSSAILSDTAVLTVFHAGAPRDLSGEAYTASIDVIHSKCDYARGAAIANVDMGFTVHATRAPSPDAASYKIPYYLVVSQGDRILNKQNLSITIDFPAGSATTSHDETVNNTIVNLEPGHPPSDYQLLVGFQLNDADRAYNAQRGRFTP